MENGQYEYAYALWKRALGREGDHREALEAMAKLQRIARDLFEEALMLQVSNPVRMKELLRTVILISDPWSELNREARDVLGEEL